MNIPFVDLKAQYHSIKEEIDLEIILEDVRKSGGLIISKTSDGWNGMDVAFA